MDPQPPQPPPVLDYTPESMLAAADRLIDASNETWNDVALIPSSRATFDNAVQPLIDEENQRLTESRILYFLGTASTSKELRDASNEATIRLSQNSIQRLTREDVYRVVDAVANQPEVKSLPWESQLYVEKLMRDFSMNGLGLADSQARAQLKVANLRLVEVLKRYISNLNADVSGIWLAPEELDGVSPQVLQRCAEKNDEGKLWVNFKTPNRVAIMSSVKSAAVRRRYFVAWDNCLKDTNGPLLTEILRLRHETARLLGYNNYAESRDGERTMSATDASRFLASVSGPLTELGRKEIEELAALKESDLKELPDRLKDESSTRDIFRWDFQYYKRIAKDSNAKMDGEKVSEYFSFQLVLPKLLQIFSLLFGLRFTILSPAEQGIQIWHEDVTVVALWNDEGEGGDFLGYLYIDPYPRDGKYGHVGQYGLQPGFTKPDGTRHYPVSCLMLNFTPPTSTRPSLLKYAEVVSSFHELGHSIHWLTGRSMYGRFHSNTPRDFVEIPSRMLEHFFFDRNIIRAVSCHYEDPSKDVKIPEDAIDKLISSRYENVASSKLSDLTFAKFDMAVHTVYEPSATSEHDLSVLHNKMRREVSLLHGPEDLGLGHATLHGETHLRFIHGYGASYYSYLLADAVSTDMFQARFQGLLTKESCSSLADIVNDGLRAEGRRYRYAVLQPGSSTGDEMGLVKGFLGRDPEPNAFINVLAAAAVKS